MKRKIFVYIAGPISKGDYQTNLKLAVDGADAVRDAGMVPYSPAVASFLAQMFRPRSYEFWMEEDFALIGQCDALLRLPGESSGADREITFSKEHGIPVFYGIKELKEWAAL